MYGVIFPALISLILRHFLMVQMLESIILRLLVD